MFILFLCAVTFFHEVKIGYLCFICEEEIQKNSQLRWHLRTMHSVVSDDHLFICYQDGCMRTFQRYISYRRHLMRSHPECEESGIGLQNDNVHVNN